MANILIVEDSILIAGAITLVLKKENMNVYTTSKGTEVINLIKTNNVDVVILDLMMPEMNGGEILKLIKNDSETKNTKVLILTAKTNALEWDESLKESDKFMTKPFENAELIKTVKDLLEK